MGAHKLGQKRIRWISGQTGRYAITTSGDVYSYLQRKRRKLKPQPHACGHTFVAIYTNGVSKLTSVHKLVLETFVGPCPPGMVCRHFPDRNPANNRLENIQWGTPKENEADKKVHGTYRSGEKHHLAKLSDKQVEFCRRMYQKYKKTVGVRGKNGAWAIRKLSSKFGISPGRIGQIIRGESKYGGT